MTQTTEMLATQAGALTYLAIPAEELDAIRMAGRDEAGKVLEIQVPPEGGGAPARCPRGGRGAAAVLPARGAGRRAAAADRLHPAGHRGRLRRARPGLHPRRALRRLPGAARIPGRADRHAARPGR